MIEVICKDGKFLAKGSFSLGLAGNFVNDDFDGEMIEIMGSLEEIEKELKNEKSWRYQPLFPYLLRSENIDGDSIAKGLAEYYNQKEVEAQQNIKQINDCFLCHLFVQLEDSGYPFWEIEEAILPGSLEGYDMDNLEEAIYSYDENVYEWDNDFYEKPNNGTISKTDVEGKLRKMFPMFNFDGLYQSIIPDGISFHGRFMEFQFSDGWGGNLFECAYDRFDENFTSCDWHNH